jgi:hypothetical protein
MTAVATWLDVLPYLEPSDLRMLLDEAGAARLAEAGFSRLEHAPAESIALVLAWRLGHPSDVIEGL